MKKALKPSRFRLPIPVALDWRVLVFSHGWVDLPPFVFDPMSGRLATAMVVSGDAVDVSVVPDPAGGLRVNWRGPAAPKEKDRDLVRRRVRRMLGLDDVLEAFWDRAQNDPDLAWAARRGAGRLLRAPTLFEDLVKILFTTNCLWAGTRSMTSRLIEAIGPLSPSGAHAFPTAEACAAEPASFYRDVVRAGYRAESMVLLARRFAAGEFADIEAGSPLETAALRKRLLGIRGFGAYAAGQGLRLLGRHDDLALDSWCRARMRELRPRRKNDDRAIARAFDGYGVHRGLALWLFVTASWHGEGAGGSPWPLSTEPG